MCVIENGSFKEETNCSFIKTKDPLAYMYMVNKMNNHQMKDHFEFRGRCVKVRLN